MIDIRKNVLDVVMEVVVSFDVLFNDVNKKIIVVEEELQV